LNLQKAVENRQDGSGGLSNSASWLWPAFKLGELALAGFQNRKVGSGGLSKDLNSPVLKSFSQIQKLFARNG
jgi:hypothetical protein